VQGIITKYPTFYPTLPEKKHTEKKLLNNDYILKLQKCGFYDIANRVAECGNFLIFSLQENLIISERRRRLKRANMCKDRFCVYCNWRRAINLSNELKNALEQLKSERDIEILFLTLTAKNEPIERLRKTIKSMNEAFHRMQRTKRFKKSILGYIKAIEILGSKTKNGESHVHFHCLLIVPKSYFSGKYYINRKEWVEMWKKALRVDYDPIVDVRRVRAKKDYSSEFAASKETIKYSVKHTDLVNRTDEDFIHIIKQTKGMRFISTGGKLREMIKLQRIEKAKINRDLEPFWIEIAEEVYKWLSGDYRLYDVNLSSTEPENRNNKVIENLYFS